MTESVHNKMPDSEEGSISNDLGVRCNIEPGLCVVSVVQFVENLPDISIHLAHVNHFSVARPCRKAKSAACVRLFKFNFCKTWET